MNSVVRQRQKKSKTKSDRLNKLWRQAERLQNQNARLQGRLDALMQRVRGELAPAQAEEGAAARELILHLLPFLQRKSLSQWQRDEIRDWIDDQLELVLAAGLMDATLEEALARDWALQRGIEIDEDSERSVAEQVEAEARREQEAAAEAFEATREQAYNDVEAWIEREVEARVRARFGETRGQRSGAAVDDLFASEFEEAEAERDEAIERFRQDAEREVREQLEADRERLMGGFEQEEPEVADGPEFAPELSDMQTATDKGLFDRLFRRAANVLHPDKEQDGRRRADKQALMGTLLEARKERDILTVFKLYQEHAGATPEIDATEENELVATLEQQIEDLRLAQQAIIEQSPAHASVYHDFYGRSRKKVDRELAELKAQAKQRAESARECVRSVRTLKALKPVLEERRDERYLSFHRAVFGDAGYY